MRMCRCEISELGHENHKYTKELYTKHVFYLIKHLYFAIIGLWLVKFDFFFFCV